MAELDPQLAILLEARTAKLEKDLARGRRAVNDNMQGMERRTKQFRDNTEKVLGKTFDNIGQRIESAFAPFLRGGVALAAIGGAAVAMKEIAGSIAEVDREARKAGVSSKTWQQWSYVATATGASVDGVTDALKELNIRANEFALTGKGSGAEWFARLGYSAEEVGRKLQDPNRFLDEIIGKLQKLDSGSRTRALDELFGGTGAEQLAKVLGLSVEEIQKLRNEAATFTDEQIQAAKKIDAEWETMWRNFLVRAKAAAIEGVGVAEKIYKALRGDYLPGYQRQQDMLAYLGSNDAKLKRAQAQRERILKQIADIEGGPDYATKALELRELKASLQAVEEQIDALGGGSDELKQALKELSDITQRAGGSFNGTAAMAGNFKSALEELKKLVPDLKAELDQLGKLDAIDAAFRKVAGSARSMGDILNAADLANRAKTMARFGPNATHDMLSLIGAAEGTDKGRGYNETLGYGAFTGGAVNLTGMTLDEVLALQKSMLAQTSALPSSSPFYNSSAIGRYQITRRTLIDMMKELGLTGDRLFNEDTQDEVARYLLRRRGNDPAGLRNEWEGLRNVDDTTIRNAYNGTPTAAQKLQPTDAQQKQIDLANKQAEASKNLNTTIQEGLDKARFEQSLSGMSASQKRVELQLFQYEQQAKRAGITLTDDEIQKMREKLTLTDQLDRKNRQAAQSQNALQQAGMFFGQTFTNSLSGLLTGTTTVTDAIRNMANALIDASLQAMLLGQGPLAALFGTAGGGGLFGAIFGFADGGHVAAASGGYIRGPGTSTSDSIPAKLSNGEFVVNAAATRQNRALLEAINGGQIRAFAAGGYAGNAPAVHRVHMPANDNGPPVQAIEINAPITVNGSAGTPEQNADLAKRMSRQLEATMRGVVVDEIRRQARPGNLLNSRMR